ncbi:MAG TPA: type II secretion system protein GspL [Rhodanobacteraceae bacterium]|nr:type II secretion system protein GspL [Rhodanobacteraceae bacterium]
MPDRLLIRLAADGDLRWLRQSADGRASGAGTSGAPPAAVLASTREILVLVPAEQVLLTEARLNARNRAQLHKALPYAVEDQLLNPVEELHFAAATARGDRVGVAIVAKATLRAWLAGLAEAGIRPDCMLPESMALESAPDVAVAMIENDRAIVRLAPWSAFACGPDELAGWLDRCRASSTMRPLDVHDFRAAAALDLPVPVATYRERQTAPLAFLARGAAAPALNLLTGEFAPRHRQMRGARWWRWAAVLAAVVVLLAGIKMAVEVARLSGESARLRSAMRDEVHKAFPELGAAELARIGPEQLMRGRLDRLRGGAESSGLLRLLAQIAPVLGSTTRIQTRGIEYRNGTLELGLRAPDVATLDNLRARFAALPGLEVEVTAANPGEAGVDGRIRISAGKSS